MGFHSQKVYFIQQGYDGPIKIGIAVDPERRLSDLQVGCHRELHILNIIPGGEAEESRIHEMFSRDLIRGEWFKPSKSLRKFIKSGAVDISVRHIHFTNNETPSLTIPKIASELKTCSNTIRRYIKDYPELFTNLTLACGYTKRFSLNIIPVLRGIKKLRVKKTPKAEILEKMQAQSNNRVDLTRIKPVEISLNRLASHP